MGITIGELLKLNIQGLPTTARGLRERAKTQNWPYIEEVGKARGGRLKKYLIASLPAEIRAAIMHHETAVGRADGEDAENLAPSQTGDGDVGSGTG